MWANRCARWVEWFLKGTAALVICVVAGIVDAEASDHDHEPFPWLASGWHWSKLGATNIARNKAIQACNEIELVLDTSQEDWSYGTVNFECPPLDFCKTATLRYYCEEPLPRTTSRKIFNVEGPLVCDSSLYDPPNTPAARAWSTTAQERCDAIRPGVGWYMSDFVITNIGSVATNSCSGGGDGWNLPRKSRFKGDITCTLHY